MIGYYYVNGSYVNVLEIKVGLIWGVLFFNVQMLFNDVVWGNKGDIYWILVYIKLLFYDIIFIGMLGVYIYSCEGKYFGICDIVIGVFCGVGQVFVVNGCFVGNGFSSGGLCYLMLGLLVFFFDFFIIWLLQVIFGGYNCFDVKQGNQLVGMLSWGF